jgi:hypothetical protein
MRSYGLRFRAHGVLRRLQPFELVDGVSGRSNMLLHSRSKMRLVFRQQDSRGPTRRHQV